MAEWFTRKTSGSQSEDLVYDRERTSAYRGAALRTKSQLTWAMRLNNHKMPYYALSIYVPGNLGTITFHGSSLIRNSSISFFYACAQLLKRTATKERPLLSCAQMWDVLFALGTSIFYFSSGYSERALWNGTPIVPAPHATIHKEIPKNSPTKTNYN